MNVALTRCRKGMVVVTDKRFLQGAGRHTLLGQLSHFWSQHRDTWIDWKAILSGPVELPGLPRPSSSSSPPPRRPLQVALDVRSSTSTPQPPTPTRSDELPRAHSTPPSTMPRCDSETEFPSLLRQPSASARSQGVRQTLQYNMVARWGPLAGASTRRGGDRPQQQQQASSTGTSTTIQHSSDSWRRRAPVPIPAAQRREGTDAAFPPLTPRVVTASATSNIIRSRGASWSVEHSPFSSPSPSRVFRQELEEISFEELSLLPSPSHASNSSHRRIQSFT
jgi:hypothetical protein